MLDVKATWPRPVASATGPVVRIIGSGGGARIIVTVGHRYREGAGTVYSSTCRVGEFHAQRQEIIMR
jgi:hypothetical protein